MNKTRLLAYAPWTYRVLVLLLLVAIYFKTSDADETADEARRAALEAKDEASYCVKEK